VGSNVITRKDGSLNVTRILRLVEDVAVLSKQGTEVILVTSGAVAAGRSDVVPSKRTDLIGAKQIWASIGQVKLMANYQFLFSKYGMHVGQILATKESFSDRRHYLNMKNCITAMLDSKVMPIVNENDSISINELMFTDNDELSGLISAMMDCQSLFILSNVDGIFNTDPGNPAAQLIREINQDTVDAADGISTAKSGFGRGGMLTKYSTAKKISSEGIDVFIANGNRDSIITDIIRGKDVPYTHFHASESKKSGVKKWLNHSDTFAKGAVYINDGAKTALLEEKGSLLMIGIIRVEGYFKSGDIVRILDTEGNYVGLGKSKIDSEKAGKLIGQRYTNPFIHRDFLVFSDESKNL
jgi:glutamate 5-kinase